MDTMVIGLWVALDPLERHLYNLARVVSSEDRSVVYQPQVKGSYIFLLYTSKELSYFSMETKWSCEFLGRSVPVRSILHVAGHSLRQERFTIDWWCLHGLGNQVRELMEYNTVLTSLTMFCGLGKSLFRRLTTRRTSEWMFTMLCWQVSSSSSVIPSCPTGRRWII